MTQFINVTDLRTQISALIKDKKSKNSTVLLKNGKPTLALIDYADFVSFQDYQEKMKQQKALKIGGLWQNNDQGALTPKAQNWLQKKKITSPKNTWEYADKVLESLEKEEL
jgi:hypothetical protein